LRQAFGAAVMRVQQSGYAENAVRGDTLFATRNGRANRAVCHEALGSDPLHRGRHRSASEPADHGLARVSAQKRGAAVPPRPLARSLTVMTGMKKALQSMTCRAFVLVGGAGFEPATPAV
jgi:hypothetical protein